MSTEPGPVLGSSAGSPEVAAPEGVTTTPSTDAPVQGSPVTYTKAGMLEQIPEAIRGEAVFQNINDETPIADMAAQFLNSQRMIGTKRMEMPDENWTPEQWGTLHEQLGRPSTVDGYVMPELEGSVVLDDKAVTEFKDLSHKLGLNTDQFQKLTEFHNTWYSQQDTANKDGQKEQIEAGLNTLRQEWGDDFDGNLAMSDKFFQTMDNEALKELVLANDAISNNPGIIKLFHQLAKDNISEALKTGDLTNPAVLNTQADAMAALKKFESDNAHLLFATKELTPQDRVKLDSILPRREELFKLAYPEEIS